MAAQATSYGWQKSAWLMLLAAVCVVPGDLVSSWTVDTSTAAKHLGGPSSYTFATLAEAQAFVNANKNYGARLVPGGFDDTAGGNSGGGAQLPGLSGGNTAGLTPQQQLALTAAQTALPLLQQAVTGLLTAPPRAATPQLPGHNQAQLAAEQFYNTGMWYFRQSDFSNAVEMFQKALQRTPGNQKFINAMNLAQQQMDLAARAAKKNTPPMAATTTPLVATPATALNLINFSSDGSVVDLRNASKTSVDPAYFKADLPPQPGGPVPTKAAADTSLDKLYQQSVIDDNNRRIELRRLESQIDDLFLQSTLEDYRKLSETPK